MGKTYTVYNKNTGQIKGTFSCPESMVFAQYSKDTEGIIEGEYDHTCQVNLNTLEIESIPLVYVEYPAYHITELKQYIQDDAALDKAIENMGEDPVTYRQDNYEIFRKWAYPDSFEFIDASVKQKDAKRKNEGNKQMDDYIKNCIEVKDRFPKKEE